MNSFLAGVEFLTILPLGKHKPWTSEQMTGSMAYYPLVGILLAGVCSVVYLLAVAFLSHLIACALVLGALAVFTGCLHLDGLADTCDGLAGGKDKEDILRIMKDSAIGPAGVIGLIILFLIKFSVLSALAPGHVPLALVLSLSLSRWSLTAACALWPYARTGHGTASVFVGRIGKKQLIRATLIAMVISLFICKWYAAAVWTGLLFCFWLFNRYILKKISGITGDTLGALCEICEVAVLLVAKVFVFS